MLKRKTPTSKPRKAYFSIFVGGIALLAGVLAVGTAAFSISPAQVASAESTTYSIPNEAVDPITQEDLSVTINSAAVTDTSESFKVNFSAAITLFNNGRYGNVWVRTPDDFSLKDETSAAQAKVEQYQNGEIDEFVPKVFDVSVYKINYASGGGNKNPSHIVIPAYINNSSFSATNPDGETINSFYFTFRVVSIETHVVFSSNATRATDWTGIESVTIPSTIESVAHDAFIGAEAAGAKIHLQDTQEEYEAKAWGTEWTDTDQIDFDATFDPEKKYDDLSTYYISPTSTNTQTLGVGENYILGCLIEEEGMEQYRKPLVAKFKYVGDDQYYYQELPVNSKNYYDAVGSSIGAKVLSIYVDLPLKTPGQTIDPESVSFHNIYYAVRRTDGKAGFLPDLDRGAQYTVPMYSVDRLSHLNDFFSSMELTGVSEFFDFTMVSIRFNLEPKAFQELNPSSYASHTEDIASGLFAVRTQFTSIPQATYEVVYDGGKTKSIKVETPIDAATIVNGSDFGFMIHNPDVGEGFSAATIEKLTIHGFNLHLDLYRSDRNSIANNSKVTVRFGNMVLFDKATAGSYPVASLGYSLTATYIIFVIAFAGLATGYYFFMKKRYKNDEFRRMNTKKYLIAAAKNFLGLGMVVSAVFFIVARWGALNNTIVVYNPCDPFVIVFTIAALIYVGITIKNFVVAIKLDTERRRKARLKLDQDVVEDGTN